MSLSVYTAGKGTNVDAEGNVLKEWTAPPDGGQWTPVAESFKDVDLGTDNGAHGRLDLKKRIIHDEFNRDLNQFENGKLQLQIAEAESLIEDNAKAIAELKKLMVERRV